MKKNIVICVAFLVFAAVYIASVAPSYNSDDSPETTLAFFSMGIQHPPGYPLTTLIGKIFTFMPLGSYMLRANLMASFFNLLAGLFIFLIVRELLAGKNNETGISETAAGLAAAAMYLFSASVWMQAISAKGAIYALNAFMTTACLWALLRMKQGIKFFYLFCFLYGLSLGNHWTSMLVILPGIIFYLIIPDGKPEKNPRHDMNTSEFFARFKAMLFDWMQKPGVKSVITGTVFMLLGAGVYIYVFLRSGTHPMYAWGDTKTLNDLIWLISRAQYAAAEQKHTIVDTMRLFSYYAGNFTLKEYPFFISLLFIPGAVLLFKRRKKEALALAISLVCLVFSVVSVATPPKNTEWLIKPYLVSANIFAGIFIALFFYYFFSELKTKYRAGLMIFVLVAATALLLFKNNPHYDRYYMGYDYSKNITMTAGKGSVVFTEGDMNIGAILYETLVKKEKYSALIPVVMQYEWYRRQVMSNYPGMFNLPENSPDMKAYIRSVLAANRDRSVFYSNVYTLAWLEGLRFYPEGLLYRIQEGSETRSVSDFYLRLYSYRGFLEDKTGYDEFTKRLVFDNYSNAFSAFAETLRSTGNLKESVKFYRFSLLFGKTTAALINMGLCYYYMKDFEGAQRSWQEAIDFEPQNALPYINMSFIYMTKQDYKTAGQYIDRALKIDPYNAAAMKVKQDLIKNGAIK